MASVPKDRRCRDALPRYTPQLATLVDTPPSGDPWIHEIKYDGYRIACTVADGAVRLTSRRGQDWTRAFPELVDAAQRLPVRSALLDGEVAVLLPDGRTSFQALQQHGTHARRTGLLVYYAFDLLHQNGEDIASQALELRKRALANLLRRPPPNGVIRYCDHFTAPGPAVFEQVCKLGLEGIVSKRRDLPYHPGRSSAWLKTKCRLRQELVVAGFTLGEGARQGIGALLLGFYQAGRLVYCGKVGNGPGFTAAYTSRLRREFGELEQPDCPFRPPPPRLLSRHAHWVRPERVAEVSFAEWTAAGTVRQPLLEGFRPDKRAADVRREAPRTVDVNALSAPLTPPRPPSTQPTLASTRPHPPRRPHGRHEAAPASRTRPRR